MANDRPTLFPSIVPERGEQLDTDLTAADVADFFNDDYQAIRQVIAEATDESDDVNGKSTKTEMKAWLAEHCTRKDLKTLADAAGVGDGDD